MGGGNGTTMGAGIAFAGQEIKCVSIAADRVYLEGTITYDGQYAGVIQDKVIEAIENYFANLAFDGTIYMLSIIDAIQSVPGVIDINIENAAIRANATAFGSKTYLKQNFTDILTSYPTFAGYVIQEDEPGETFADKIIFTPQ
jgi:hypothetical protein